MIRRNTPARVVHSAVLAFFVRAECAADRHTTGASRHPGNYFPTLSRSTAPIPRLDDAVANLPCRPNARRSFSGARQVTSVAPAPVKDFQSAVTRRRCAPLTGTNPHWCGAQVRQKTGGPPRRCTGGTGVTPITHLYTVRARALIVRRPVKARASRRWRALTGRQGHRYDAAHRARHQREESI